MDIADKANDHIEKEQAAALEAAVEAARAANGISAMSCQDCGETIPEERREAAKGCTRCAECQSKFEKRAAVFRNWMRPFA